MGKKYLETKKGSLEQSILGVWEEAAKQTEGAMKRGKDLDTFKPKPKKENNFIYAAKMAKKNGEKTFTIGSKQYDVEEILQKETNKNDKSDDGDGLDAVQPKAVKKKFADRKDKDIDNDGDVDDSDKFLHKRRKAVAKNMKERWEEAYRQVQEKAKVKEDEHEMDDDEKDKPMKKGKTDTGKKPDEIKMNPDMEDEGYHKKKK
tara:strand:- start:4478 stop:5086 length:609 start_codon:yes stop_codon:yes gene_type:complete